MRIERRHCGGSLVDEPRVGAGVLRCSRRRGVALAALGAATSLLAHPGSGVAVIATTAEGVQRCVVPTGETLPHHLLRGDLEVATWGLRGVALKEGCVLGLVRAPFATVVAVLDAPERFAEFMPRVLLSAVERIDEATLLNRQRINLPFPVGDREFTIRVVADRGVEAGREQWQAKWTLVPGSGNIVENRGAWTVINWERNVTLVRYQLLSDPGGAVPAWVVNRLGPATLERIIGALRRRSAEADAGRWPMDSGGGD